MNKYEPLKRFLEQQGLDAIPMTFEQIEKMIGEKLPNSAFKHRPWWSNNPSNSVITKSWLEAGYKTAAVDMEHHKLTFKKVSTSYRPQKTSEHTSAAKRSSLEELLGSMKGTITIKMDFDPTKPTGQNWNAEGEQV